MRSRLARAATGVALGLVVGQSAMPAEAVGPCAMRSAPRANMLPVRRRSWQCRPEPRLLGLGSSGGPTSPVGGRRRRSLLSRGDPWKPPARLRFAHAMRAAIIPAVPAKQVRYPQIGRTPMRKTWFITVAAVLLAALAIPSSAAAARPQPTPEATHMGAGAPDDIDTLASDLCYQVRTAGGWGAVKCDGIDGPDGEPAGCFGCTLEAISAYSIISVTYRVRTPNGWGAWRNDGETAGCVGCKIEAIELTNACSCFIIEYRVRTASGWGDWRSNGVMAGCFGCTVEAIQMRIVTF
jgi:hypothetical protein